MTSRFEELKGRVKEGTGELTDDPELEAEGKGQAEGARARRKIEGAAKEAGGAIKEAAGKATGKEDWELEGKADRAKGKIERTG